MATTESEPLRIAEIPTGVKVDPVTLDIIEGRAEERPLRDGRGALPLGDEPRHPGAARRVPDDHRPARPHGRRPVRRLHQRDDGRLGPGRVPGRRDPHLRPVQVLRLDLAHERLARAPADLLRGRARRLVEPVRPPDGRGRPAPGLAADGRPDDLRGGASSSRRSRSSSGARCRRTSSGSSSTTSACRR